MPAEVFLDTNILVYSFYVDSLTIHNPFLE